MGVRFAVFESAGKRTAHLIPTGVSRIDTEGTVGLGVGISFDGIVIGESFGGEPGKPLILTDSTQAKNILVGGDLLNGIIFALEANSNNRPFRVLGMRMNPAIKATLTLQASANDVIDLEDRDFGERGNAIRGSVSNGSTEGKKIIIQKGSLLETFDNVIGKIFNITYTGGGAPVLNITATQLTVTGTPGATDDIAVLFTEFTTMDDIINEIASFSSNYTISLVSNADAESTLLDLVSSQDISSIYTVEATNETIIQTISLRSAIANAKFPSSGFRSIPDNIALTAFTGGSEGTTDFSSLTGFLNTLVTENIRLVSLLSESSSLQDAVKSHIEFSNSDFGNSFRGAFFGDSHGKTISVAITDAKARALSMNNPAINYCINGFTRRDAFGIEKDFGSFFRGAMELGMKVSLPIPEPTTNKEIDVIKSEFAFDRAQLEELISAGVNASSPEPGSGLVKTKRMITTVQKQNLIENEFSMFITALIVSDELRAFIELRHKGKVLDGIRQALIRGDIRLKLREFRDDGLFTGDASNPAFIFNDTDVTFNGDISFINYFANVSSPANFFFITNRFGFFVSLSAA